MTPLPRTTPSRPAGATSLLLAPDLRVLAADAAALALIEGHTGLMSLRQGRFYLPRQQTALEAAVTTLLSSGGPKARGLALQRPGQPPLTLKLERQPGIAQLWLHLVDVAAPRLEAEVLGSMFGLTATEQRVALLLAQGLSSEDMASRLGVQSNTVRGHIKQLLAKTHTRRQAQLVAWLWRSAAVTHPCHIASTPDPLIPGGERCDALAPYPNG